jgi:quercetin dioxygenase-like cupin family protein
MSESNALQNVNPGQKQDAQAVMRDKIMALEAAMLAMPERAVHIEPKHYFAPGLYLREITIPKGVTITGKIHKTEHLCILSKGDVSVWNGDGTHRLSASSVVKSMPGTKRAIYAHEDSVWINCHHNPLNETDLDKIEDIYIAKTFEEAIEHASLKQIQGGTE